MKTYSILPGVWVTGRYDEAEWPEHGTSDRLLILEADTTQNMYSRYMVSTVRRLDEDGLETSAQCSLSAVLDNEVWLVLKGEFRAFNPSDQYRPATVVPSWPRYLG